MRPMQTGEVLRRVVFNALDAAKGGKLKKLKEVNKRKIIEGVTEEYIERRTKVLLDYVKVHSPYYKNHPEWKELSDFPVFTKGDYIEHYDEILSDTSKEQGNLYKLSTSGSTGTPFTVLCDGDKMNRVNMNFISCMELNGFRMGMKRGEFRAWIKGKNTISKWKSFKNNLIMIDISNMGDESLEGICRDIEKKKIQVLVAYSSALTALTQYLERTGRDMKKWKVEMVFSMGEALPDATYDLIKKLFGFSPVRSYGNNENGFIGIQLGEDPEYTIDLYNFYPEILKMDSDEPAEPGELGRIVVTDYYNKTFPMVRYDTGDTGKIRIYRDEKGRVHGKFVEIYGRRGSLMYNCQGQPLSIHVFMNILLKFEGIVHQARCIQWEKTKYELLINADREKLDIEEVLAAYRSYLGEEAEIQVTYVDELPIQASGKFMVCENRCSDYL
ncbi:MAG: phenylacetate--CoA ligase family protein [Oliverpabstia sp.]